MFLVFLFIFNNEDNGKNCMDVDEVLLEEEDEEYDVQNDRGDNGDFLRFILV